MHQDEEEKWRRKCQNEQVGGEEEEKCPKRRKFWEKEKSPGHV